MYRRFERSSIVYVTARDRSLAGNYEVVYCIPHKTNFRVGLESRPDMKHKPEATEQQECRGPEPDHYEVLQISRKAEAETIHRVFRMMAMRFHPDNPETGDVELFLRMKRAYAVLSDPRRRSEYDAELEGEGILGEQAKGDSQ